MVRTPATICLAALLVVLGVGTIGCGAVAQAPKPKPPVEKRQYLAQIQTIRRELGKRFVRQQPKGALQTRVTAELTQLKDGTGEFSERLSDLKPPLEARNAHALWVRGLKELAEDTQPIIDAVSKGSARDYRSALARLLTSSAVELTDAQVLFDRLRYPVKTTPSLPPTLKAFQSSQAMRKSVLK